MTAPSVIERPRHAAADYEAAFLAAVERAQRFDADTATLTRLHDERTQRLAAIRGPRMWRAPEVRA